MKRILLGASILSVALATTVWAQSKDTMRMDKGMAPMTGNAAYVGCIESVNHGARFILTHVSDGTAMNDTMKKPDSKMESMKHDDMKDMKHDDMKSGDRMGMMAPESFALKTTAVDLRKHVGQKVSLTGTRAEGEGADMTPTLTVSALKVVAKSCR